MRIVTEFSEMFGIPNGADENNDCTDFPTRPCKQCGRKARPQWRGVCNDGSCDHFDNEKEIINELRKT